MFLRLKTILAIMAVDTGILLSQQLPFSNQYLVNRQSLSPAYAGITGNFETFVSYQKNSLQFPGGPEYKSLFLSGPVYGNMSLGASVSKSSVTIFNGISGQLDYAYHLRISNKQFIHFGLSFAYNEDYLFLDYNQIQSLQGDPYGMEPRKSMSYGFGLIYSFQNFQLGITIPRLGEFRIENHNAGGNYSVPGLVRIHASYLFDLSQSFSIEPSVVADKSETEPLWYNASALVRIKQVTWLEIHYRQGGILGMGIGVNPTKKMVFSYTYDLSGTGLMKYSAGIHEISVGFQIGNNSDKQYQKSAFRAVSKQPYYDWIK
jgi:type IX secretion system PorP/SprF family membrane protein